MRVLRKFWWTIPAIILLAVLGFVIWASGAAAPMPEALDALQTEPLVKVTSSDWLVFTPTGVQPITGLIFYPGGKVDARAYAPAARAIAEKGYLVVITPMPLNLAVFSPNEAAAVIKAYPQITAWAIGGHSLGGTMACAFAFSNPGAVSGVVLWGSYPADGNSLAGLDLKVVSIYGSLDGLSTPAKIDATRLLLPASTRFVKIEGGDHAQFGWYGPQAGDNPATISRQAQQDQVVQETVDFLSTLSH